MGHRPIRALLVTALVSAGLATAGFVATAGGSGAAATRVKPPLPYYLSLGDSYSVGYQPGIGATAGYTAVVAKRLKLQLENFGCGGATSSSILTAIGCLESGYGPVAATDAVPYPTTTQEQAAIDFIENPTNAGKVGLITVSIGGNDITGCLGAGDATAITNCVIANAATVETNVTTLGTDLRNALDASGDSSAKIVGLTYPDVVLGEWVNPGGPSGQSLATLSQTAFKSIINPDLERGLHLGGGRRCLRGHHERHRRLRLDDPPGHPRALREDPGSCREGLRAHLLLLPAEHPREHDRL